MHCHDIATQLKNVPKNAKKIVLAGNPNAGKSVFFNAFTGMYVDVSNFPGTTIDISYGKYKDYIVIDTPGVYGVSSFNDEEIVARDIITSADIVVNVVDAVHLDRDLFLTQQIIDMGIPIIIALNMMDEAKAQGIEIDVDKLSQLLGVPVIPTVAVKNLGIEEVKNRLEEAKVGNSDPELQSKLAELLKQVHNRAEALLILEDDPHVAKRHQMEGAKLREEIYTKRRQRVNEIIDQVVRDTKTQSNFKMKLSRWMVNPLTGVPILIGILYIIYKLIAVFVAQTVVDFTEGYIFAGLYEPFIRGIIGQWIPENSALGTILIGEFGVLTMTVTYVLGLLLPLVIGFYFALSVMEDSGYLPRVAALVDRVLMKLGLNGRAIIPLILGFGCVTMATITTRLLGSKREKFIATALLGFTIPCSAQLGIIAGLITPLGWKLFILYVGIIFIVFVLIGTLLNLFLPGESTDLLIDLPPLRLPRINNVLKKTWTKSYAFIKEAGPLFALGALLIGLLQVTGALDMLIDAVAPITTGLLKLPKESAVAFIMGIIRRDFGAAGLTSIDMTPLQTVLSLVVITLFVPCIASILVLFKERGIRDAILIWGGSWILAFGVGGIMAALLL
ncbi:ferrous iron transport protein B [Anoxybacter fermentans]|uniref:Ferrous iron transport protein B n=2 Tax=Anoxybacter fermentans TaxID=1323375 RepID=A0A3Q9HR21_9FIRM|nr:ferrous iron transport protein B [Anoxybacter fermentans]AZR73526.1 ferrous iron transport protein B [Anoxybacter fermentans]